MDMKTKEKLSYNSIKISRFVLEQGNILDHNISKHNHCQIGTVLQSIQDKKYKSNKKNKTELRKGKKNQEKTSVIKKLQRKTRKNQEKQEFWLSNRCLP